MRVLTLILIASLVPWRLTTAAVQPPQSQTQYKEPAAPEPTEAVQDAILKINRLGDAKKNAEALESLQRLVKFARELGDQVGEAEAQRGSAIFLERLDRTEEAAVVWRTTSVLWMSVDATPERIESLLRLALLLATTQPDVAASLLRDAQQLAAAETRRPLAAALELHLAGNDWYHIRAFSQARDLWTSALNIRQRLIPELPDTAASLNNLGALAQEQGNWNSAREFYQRALVIFRSQDSESLDTASALSNLGNIEQHAVNFDVAELNYLNALRIQEKRIPGSLPVSITLNNLGALEYSRGDLNTARVYYDRALEIQLRNSAGSLNAARSLSNLGAIAGDQGELNDANIYFNRALVTFERIVPHSLDVAAASFNLAVIAEKQKRIHTALDYAQKAWNVAREQFVAVAGDESRQAFNLTIGRYGAMLMRCQLALGKTDAAFVTLEQGRAQSLRQLLAERSTLLTFASGNLRQRLKETIAQLLAAESSLDRARRAAEYSTGFVNEPLSQNSTKDLSAANAEVKARSKRLEKAQSAYVHVRQETDQLWADIQRNAPRIFAPPSSPEQAQKALSPGTVFLAFAVDEEQTNVFMIRNTSDLSRNRNRARGRRLVTAHSLKISATDLTRQISEFRTAVSNARSDEDDLVKRGRELFQKVFPAEFSQALLKAKRLLISPDGPFWQLPFAALPWKSKGRFAYVGEVKPITYTQSITLFRQARDRHSETEKKRAAVVIGNAIFNRRPPANISSGAPVDKTRSLIGNIPLVDLPNTRTEALNIARLYQGDLLLQEDATEAALRDKIEKADIIHLATHSRFDPLASMSSGIFLTPNRGSTEANDDGVLQAWEIFSQLTLKADLVVMSACESGRGQVLSGEGIIGLTRSLQYAGARSIVASQWRIPDMSTGKLMISFHEHLLQGKNKDESLRQAIEMIRNTPGTAHPYYWSAFFLMGDPQGFA